MQTAEASSPSPQMPNASSPADSIANARQSTQLSMIAASASEMVPHGLPLGNEGGNQNLNWSSRLFDGENPDVDASQLSLDASQEQQLQQHPGLTAATQRAASYPRPIAMNPNTHTKGFVNDFGNATKPNKPKVRGRFSATRRKEVKEVRKRGACMRCRMLKKPVWISIVFVLLTLIADTHSVLWGKPLRYLQKRRKCSFMETTMYPNPCG